MGKEKECRYAEGWALGWVLGKNILFFFWCVEKGNGFHSAVGI